MKTRITNKRFEQIYSLVRDVPYGKVTTYGSIAKKLGMSARIVGYALHLNPDGAKNPCHRVVNRDGRVAPAYTFGGRDEQRRRLEKEGIKFKDEQHLDLKKYSYKFCLYRRRHK